MQNCVLLFLFITFLSSCEQSAPTSEKNYTLNIADTILKKIDTIKTEFQKNNKMDKNEFWKIIEYARPSFDINKKFQAKRITEQLQKYSASQIIEFEKIFRQILLEADDYKIVAAEKIIQGWVTDDPYLYFRCWLIGQGENTFYETLKNPDFLSDKIDKQTDTDFENLLYVATEAYEHRTGKKEEDDGFPRNIVVEKNPELDYDMPTEPTKGKDFQNEDLPKLYPKLWARFH